MAVTVPESAGEQSRSTLPGWFTESRFGMFIHWGIYSLAARGEWVKNLETLSDDQYQRYLDHFDPDRFDPDSWMVTAKAAGMRYVVFTAKHHDGFCLWPSRFTDYSVASTPYGRDVVRQVVDAARRHGLKVGLYYSLIDWHHPDFPLDSLHPARGDGAAAGRVRDMGRYRQYLRDQVAELLGDYAPIDYLFFDFSYPDKGPQEWGSDELLRLVRELAPDCIVNDRLGIEGDFVTPEQYQPTAPLLTDGVAVPWEACQTLSGLWGYQRDGGIEKPAELLVRMLIDGVAQGGNMLLNVGPTARGEIEATACARLHDVGEWLDRHARAIYGAGSADSVAAPDGCRLTQRGDRLYLHIYSWPLASLDLVDLADRLEYAQLVSDGSEIPFEVGDPTIQANLMTPAGKRAGTVTLKLPIERPPGLVPVIELFLTPRQTA